MDGSRVCLDFDGYCSLADFSSRQGREVMAIAIVAKLNIASGKESEFEKIMLDLVREVRSNEPGNQLYTLCKDQQGNYLVLEIYDSPEAAVAHRESAHFKAAGPKFASVMTGPPDIQRLQILG